MKFTFDGSVFRQPMMWNRWLRGQLASRDVHNIGSCYILAEFSSIFFQLGFQFYYWFATSYSNSQCRGTGSKVFDPRATHLGLDHARFWPNFLKQLVFCHKSTNAGSDFRSFMTQDWRIGGLLASEVPSTTLDFPFFFFQKIVLPFVAFTSRKSSLLGRRKTNELIELNICPFKTL